MYWNTRTILMLALGQIACIVFGTLAMAVMEELSMATDLGQIILSTWGLLILVPPGWLTLVLKLNQNDEVSDLVRNSAVYAGTFLTFGLTIFMVFVGTMGGYRIIVCTSGPGCY